MANCGGLVQIQKHRFDFYISAYVFFIYLNLQSVEFKFDMIKQIEKYLPDLKNF